MALYVKFEASYSNSPKKIDLVRVAHSIKVDKSRKIYVLRPLIDHVSIVLRRDSAALQSPGLGMTPDEFWTAIFKEFQGYKNDSGDTSVKGISSPPPYTVGLEFPLGGNKATLRLFGKPSNKMAGPVRLEFNPRRFDADSPAKLLEAWKKLSLNQVNLSALLYDARVTRVDVAVDVLNLPFHDLVVTSKKVRQTRTYGSNDASVETLQFFTDKTGKRRAKLQVYDKQKQLIAKDRKPKWGDTPHIRIEASCVSTNGLWRNLSTLKFPFAGFEFRRVPSIASPLSDELRRFADSGRFRGWSDALHLMPQAKQSKVQLAFDKLPQDLVNESQLWKHWLSAIEKAHLVPLIPS